MERKCPVCGSDEIIAGDLRSSGGFVFVPSGQKSRLSVKSSYVTAYACKRCGEVFGFRLADSPDKLTEC